VKIGIIGSGRMGAALGALWVRAGHDVCFGDIDEAKAQAAVEAAEGGRACDVPHAAEFGDIVLLSPPWPKFREALQMCGPMQGKIVIEILNPLRPDFSGLEIGFDTSAAEEVAKAVPQARVVKAFNVLPSPLLDPAKRPSAEKISIFFCGDDPEARELTAQLITDCNFDPVDCGALKAARYLEPMAMLLMHMVFQQKLPAEIGFRFLRPA
jgi:8-hydroxy-5-deazaflavin:NADPH oxidoreductase